MIEINGTLYYVDVVYNQAYTDCYTVFVDNFETEVCDVISMSEKPSHPQGVFSYLGDFCYNEDEALERGDKPIEYSELPDSCKIALANWLKEQ